MKKRLLITVIVFLAITLAISACGGKQDTSANVDISAKQPLLSITTEQVSSYDFCSLFVLTVNGETATITSDYLDLGGLTAAAGDYTVTCTYRDKTSTVTVTVTDIPVIVLTAKQTQLSLRDDLVQDYDFCALFELTENAQAKEIIDSYLNMGGLCTTPGDYTVTCLYRDKTAEVKVSVIKAVISLTAKVETMTIKDELAESYDYRTLFELDVSGDALEIQQSFLQLGGINKQPGKYLITCFYKGQTANVEVEVIPTIYTLDCSQTQVTLSLSLLDGYDFVGLFSLKKDGEALSITQDMVTSTVIDEIGSYTVTVSAFGQNKTLIVLIKGDHTIDIVPAFSSLNIPLDELENFDFCDLFTLYLDKIAVRVTADMLDTAFVQTAEVGNSYSVTLTYTMGNTTENKSVIVTVVPQQKPVLTAVNKATYPNGGYIDLCSLFTITDKGENIPVTADMVQGTIDYSVEGDNNILLTYMGETATAVVSVSRGVIISRPKGETILVKTGTDKASYAFTNDFKVLINGIEFKDFESYIDYSTVDFSAVGEYTATLKIPYNTSKLTITGVKFTYFECAVTYKVVDVEYSISLAEQLVTLEQGQAFYPYKNLSVLINGRRQTLTETVGYEDIISCYAKIVSALPDYNNPAVQSVEIQVYVYGAENEPVTVSYDVLVKSEIVITATEKIVFCGETLFAKDLFKLSVNGEAKEITEDMLSGCLNLFKPGVYTLFAEYLGVRAQACVTVYDNAVKSVYHTPMKTIGTPPDAEDYDEEGYENEKISSVPLGDFVFEQSGEIMLGDKKLDLIAGIDQNTMLVKIGSNPHTLYIKDGIAVFIPDNSIKLSFNNSKRPLVYFDERIWTVEDYVQINSGSSDILTTDSIGRTIEAVHVVSAERSVWYALFIKLVSKSSGDTIYELKWGEVTVNDNFSHEKNATNTVCLNNDTVTFTMTNANLGKIAQTEVQKLYAGITFTGTYQGKPAILSADAYENYTLTVDGTKIVTCGNYELSSMKIGGVDYANGIIHLASVSRFASDPFYSYKFTVDPTAKSFEFIPRDIYYGKYIANSKYIFFDGYGTGMISFDTSSYYTTSFEYSINNSFVTLNYTKVDSTFDGGEYALLHYDSLGNLLTADYFANSLLIGTVFENQIITDGAIVRIKSYKIGKAANAIGLDSLLKNIEIITKDGVISDEVKQTYIDTSKLRFGTAGFYQICINIPKGNGTITAYYAIQVLEPVYEGNALASAYGNGVIYPNNLLMLDKYAQATVSVGSLTFEGTVAVSDNAFVVKAAGASGSVVLNGTKVANGIVQVRCTGSASFNDYFVRGFSYVAGTNGFVLRRFVVGTDETYILCNSVTQTGTVVSVVLQSGASVEQSGAILKIINGESVYFAKIESWNNATQGLTLSDGLRNTYTLEEKPDLSLDGFGNAVYGSDVGTYVTDQSIVLINIKNSVKALTLNGLTYSIANIALDKSLVMGKSFTATYDYFVEYEAYSTVTTFIFDNQGNVSVQSASKSYSDEYGSYKPEFVSTATRTAAYFVSGNKLSLNIAEYVFVFELKSVLNCKEMICVSTTLSDESQGYFKASTVFEVD